MIPFDNILSNVNGTLNAITLSGDAVDEILLVGHGAGMMPTASAVVSDISDIARDIVSGGTGRVPVMGYQPDKIRSIDVLSIEDIVTNYYFRFVVLDQPGVLAAISGVLGNHDISIKSVHQKGRKTDGSVPIIILTHQAKEADVNRALKEIASLDVVDGEPLLVRIEEEKG
jgi:homoserine dehydrogenase